MKRKEAAQKITMTEEEIAEINTEYEEWEEEFNKRMDNIMLEIKRAKVSLKKLQDEEI